MLYTADSLEKMDQFAGQFVATLVPDRQAVVVGLLGDLGSGKTTFVQDLARHLGVTEEVTSPTFIIQKSYTLPEESKFSKLVHIDAYRLDAPEELTRLGFAETLKDEKALILVEWPEKVSKVLPQKRKELSFKFVDENTREITYEQ